MRKVVDSNYLRSPDLAGYLAKGHEIVLTEFILMEQFRRNATVTVRHSFEICSRWAGRVITLKRSPEILALATRSKGLAHRMIDGRQTAAFADFCRAFRQEELPGAMIRHIRQREAESAAHMALLLDEAKLVPAIFDRLSRRFTPSELIEIRSMKPLARSTQEKLIETMFEESKRLYLVTEVEPRFLPETRADAVNAFPFRYALCLTLLYMRWIRDGKQRARAPEKVRNDIVDANTAAFATYFDGVLSRDCEASERPRGGPLPCVRNGRLRWWRGEAALPRLRLSALPPSLLDR